MGRIAVKGARRQRAWRSHGEAALYCGATLDSFGWAARFCFCGCLFFCGAAASKGRQQAARGAKRQAARGGWGACTRRRRERPARSAWPTSVAQWAEGGTPEGAEGAGPLQAARGCVRTTRATATPWRGACSLHPPHMREHRAEAWSQSRRRRATPSTERNTLCRGVGRGSGPAERSEVTAGISADVAQRSGLPRSGCVGFVHGAAEFAEHHPQAARIVRSLPLVGVAHPPGRFDHACFFW